MSRPSKDWQTRYLWNNNSPIHQNTDHIHQNRDNCTAAADYFVCFANGGGRGSLPSELLIHQSQICNQKYFSLPARVFLKHQIISWIISLLKDQSKTLLQGLIDFSVIFPIFFYFDIWGFEYGIVLRVWKTNCGLTKKPCRNSIYTGQEDYFHVQTLENSRFFIMG